MVLRKERERGGEEERGEEREGRKEGGDSRRKKRGRGGKEGEEGGRKGQWRKGVKQEQEEAGKDEKSKIGSIFGTQTRGIERGAVQMNIPGDC